MICTFFGHRKAPREIQPKLEKTLINLIKNENADTFYVGKQGNFDNIVISTLKTLKTIYPHINYSVVLAYMPGKENDYYCNDYSDTIYPEGLESTPPKYAVFQRNKWLVEHSDVMITYVKYSAGGAAKFKELAEKNGKIIISI